VKNFLFIVAFIIVLILVCIVIDWFLPNQVHNGLVLTSLHFIKEIGLVIVLGIFVFFGCKAFRIVRNEKSPSQEFIKMLPASIIWFVVMFSAANFIIGHGDETDCRKYNYNDKLNGGVKEINGKKYTIKICGSGVNDNHFFGDSMDEVRLEILNEQGELLAKRYYKVFWGGQPGHEPIEVRQDSIIYQDDADTFGKPRTITMPPTFLDWIRARFPVFN